MYDKVLCDVPCSGDGAIRKIPNKWRFWSYKDGSGLHGLQVITIFLIHIHQYHKYIIYYLSIYLGLDID